MKPADRGKTGSLATCIPPSLPGHLVGVFVGNFVGNFVDIFVSISVSISCTLLFFCGRFRGACQNSSWRASWLENKCFFNFFSRATKWPVRGAFRGLSGTPSGASPWAASEPCILKSQRFCGFRKAPLKPLSPTIGQ